MTVETLFTLVVVLYTVSNLTALGVETKRSDAQVTLRNVRAIALIVLWGWIVGPLLALAIVWLISLNPGHVAGLLLLSLAPSAPFYPMLVRKANGDMAFAAAFMLVASLATVILLPLLAPYLIDSLDVDAASLAEPLIVMVLLPLLAGIALRHFRHDLAEVLLPILKRIGDISLLLCMALIVWLYWQDMVGAIGSFAPGAIVLFLIAITAVSYRFSVGLDGTERAGMALGMCTRNLAPVFAAHLGIANPPDGLLAMIILSAPLALIVALLVVQAFSKKPASA